MDREKTKVHFVGIGGIGMSGIAEVLLNQGYCVSGSDLSETDTTRRLKEIGARIFLGHQAENVDTATVVVVSSAIRPNNPEVIQARKLRIPVVPRAEMLAELMRGKVGIAVAGTHGKTTTTSMLAQILTYSGLDPTLVIGGRVNSFGGNAKLGQGQFVIAEADESDGSFLHLPATFGVVTSVDNDHLDHFGSLQAIEDAFVQFEGKLPFYGLAAVCGEDPGVKRCIPRFTKPFQTYGFSEECDVYVKDVKYLRLGSQFNVWMKEDLTSPARCLGEVKLSVPGSHNILNALAGISIARRLEIPFAAIASALSEFTGVKRRFEIRWQDMDRKRVIVDDYGHHPTEISVTLAAARAFWDGRIVSIFQPHRYSRTLLCKDGFQSAFLNSDCVLVTDIYAAGEEPIPGVDAQTLVQDLRKVARPHQKILYTGTLESTQEQMKGIFQDGDLVVCFGAGSITRLPDKLIPTFA